MRKRQGVAAGVLIVCCLLLLAAPAGAAGAGNPGGLTMAAAYDSGDEIIAAEFAVVVRYGDKTYVDVPASLLSAQAASYKVVINDRLCPMQYDSTWDVIEVAEFTVNDPGNSLGVPGPGIASQGEQVYLVYYYLGDDEYMTDAAKIQITGYLELESGVVLYDFEQLEKLQSDFEFPMSVINASGQVVAYAAQTGSGVAVYTYIFDETGFSGGAAQAPDPTQTPRPTPEPAPAQTASAGSPGRDPVHDDPTTRPEPAPGPTAEPAPGPTAAPVREPEDRTLLYAGAGGAVVVIGLILFFTLRKKGGSGGGNTAPAYYPPTAPSGTPSAGPADIPPTAPAGIPPTAPSDQPPAAPVPPAAPKKVTPVVYGEGGEMDGRRYVITLPTMTIGRETSCNICYSSGTPGISHRHCVLAMRNGVLMLIDNGSTYGTYLHGTGRLTPQQPVALKDGDVFYLGEKKNAFRLTFE